IFLPNAMLSVNVVWVRCVIQWVAVWQEFRGTVEEYLKEFNEARYAASICFIGSDAAGYNGETEAKDVELNALSTEEWLMKYGEIQKLVELNNLPICTLQLFYKEPRFKLPSPFNKEFWVKASTLWYFDFWQIMFSVLTMEVYNKLKDQCSKREAESGSADVARPYVIKYIHPASQSEIPIQAIY
ncbi:hypothetical protein ACJX0J_030924, partial [Zea mays]